jgi:hypothetical protein
MQPGDLDFDPRMLYMMAHLLRNSEVTRIAIDRVEVNDFNAQTERDWQLMWAISREFYKQHGVMPPQLYLAGEGKKRLVDDFSGQGAAEEFDIKVATVFAADELRPDWGKELITEFLTRRRIDEKLRDAYEKNLPMKQRLHMWDQCREEKAKCEFTSSAEVSPFADFTKACVGVAPKKLLGIPFLDELMFGGYRPGELCGFLSPSGGGKTTMANQILIESARRERKALMLTYEQPLDNEYFIPVYAAATRIGRDIWDKMPEGADVTQFLNEAQLNTFKDACGVIGKNLHYIDMSGSKSRDGSGGIKEIEDKIIYTKEKLGGLDIVVLDWFWTIITRSYETMKLGYGKHLDIRVYAQGFLSDLKAVVAKHGVFCWLPHQANPNEAKKSKKLSFEDAAELKSFAWYMNGCFCLNKLDEPDQTAPLMYSKARTAKPDSCMLKLHGNLALFQRIDGDMVYDTRLGKYVKKTELNAVPDSQGNSRNDYAGRSNQGAGSL